MKMPRMTRLTMLGLGTICVSGWLSGVYADAIPRLRCTKIPEADIAPEFRKSVESAHQFLCGNLRARLQQQGGLPSTEIDRLTPDATVFYLHGARGVPPVMWAGEPRRKAGGRVFYGEHKSFSAEFADSILLNTRAGGDGADAPSSVVNAYPRSARNNPKKCPESEIERQVDVNVFVGGGSATNGLVADFVGGRLCMSADSLAVLRAVDRLVSSPASRQKNLLVKLVMPVAAHKPQGRGRAEQRIPNRPWYPYKPGGYHVKVADERRYEWDGPTGLRAAAGAIDFLLREEVRRTQVPKTFLFGYSAGAVLSLHVAFGGGGSRGWRLAEARLAGVFNYQGMMHSQTLLEAIGDHAQGAGHAASAAATRGRGTTTCPSLSFLGGGGGHDSQPGCFSSCFAPFMRTQSAAVGALVGPAPAPVTGLATSVFPAQRLQLVTWAADELDPRKVVHGAGMVTASAPSRQCLAPAQGAPLRRADADAGGATSAMDLEDDIRNGKGQTATGKTTPRSAGVPTEIQRELEALIERDGGAYFQNPPIFPGKYVIAKTKYVFEEEEAFTSQDILVHEPILQKGYQHGQIGEREVGKIAEQLELVLNNVGDETSVAATTREVAPPQQSGSCTNWIPVEGRMIAAP